MYIRQTDLLWGLSQNVVNRVMAIAEREAFAQGDAKITIAETGTQVYTGSRVGEAFGRRLIQAYHRWQWPVLTILGNVTFNGGNHGQH